MTTAVGHEHPNVIMCASAISKGIRQCLCILGRCDCYCYWSHLPPLYLRDRASSESRTHDLIDQRIFAGDAILMNFHQTTTETHVLCQDMPSTGATSHFTLAWAM